MARILLTESAVRVGKHGSALTESTGVPGYIVENASQDKLIVRLPVTVLDEKNENGRVYSRSIMESAMSRTKKNFESRELLSTADEHPDEPYPSPIRSSHIVIDAWCESDGYLWNRWEILDTRNGQDLRALIESGASFGVSIRGLGSMDNFGNIMDDYEYLGTDCVGQPSARIRTAPIVVNESSSPTPTLSENTITKGNNSMSTFANLEAAKKHLEEQITLARNESKMDAFKRVMRLDESLASSASVLDPRSMGSLFAKLDEFKESLFKDSKETIVEGSAAGKQDPEVAELKEQLRALSSTFRTKVLEMAQKFKDKESASIAKAKKQEAMLRREKIRVSLLSKRVVESTQSKLRLEKSLALAVKRRSIAVGALEERTNHYNEMTKVAATIQTKYVEACRVAASIKKESQQKQVVKPTVVVESSVPVVGARLVPTKPKASLESTKRVSRRITEANLRGTTSIPGFI